MNEALLKHFIFRFREKESWNRSPDPIAPRTGNVMYSGHVAQNWAIYESISGDLNLGHVSYKYGDATEYTFEKILQEHQKWQLHYKTGGVSCGDAIYMVCNGHAHSSNTLYVATHPGTNYTSLKSKWRDFITNFSSAATKDGSGARISQEHTDPHLT